MNICKYPSIFIFFSILLYSVSFSQDIIYKIDGTEIKSKVLEITTDVIKYKIFDHLSSPARNISISEVFMIIYEDGTREVLKKSDESIKLSALYRIKNENEVLDIICPYIGAGFSMCFFNESMLGSSGECFFGAPTARNKYITKEVLWGHILCGFDFKIFFLELIYSIASVDASEGAGGSDSIIGGFSAITGFRFKDF